MIFGLSICPGISELMNTQHYKPCYILDGHMPRQVSLMEYMEWLETHTKRVALDNVGPLTISTVFLGLDQRYSDDGPPLLFETMIFDESVREWTDYQTLCCTWDEAEQMHSDAIEFARRATKWYRLFLKSLRNYFLLLRFARKFIMRTFHRVYAWLFGYFWLPCPVCGRMFGGHEIHNINTTPLLTAPGTGKCVCPDPECSRKAAVLNKQHFPDFYIVHRG